MNNTVAVLLRKAPYGSVYTAEALRTLMGIGVFEADINVLFVDDGVYALVKEQNPAQLDMKPLGGAFASLAEFGVNKLYVHDESLAERGLTLGDLLLEVQVVDGPRVAQLLMEAGKVLPF
jgi:tRNA 2-thiouridine synthesizing protein C